MLPNAPAHAVSHPLSRLPVPAAWAAPVPRLPLVPQGAPGGAPGAQPLGQPARSAALLQLPSAPRARAHGSLADRRQVAQRLLAFGSW